MVSVTTADFTGGTTEEHTPSSPSPNGTVPLRTVAIVGFAEASRDRANQEPPTTEIWGLNRCYTILRRWDRWFEMHDGETVAGQNGLREAGYAEVLRQSKAPVYMLEPDSTIPTAVLYPKVEICAAYLDYFTSSIAYMIALAVYEHNILKQPIGVLKFFGVEMSSFSEYAYQRSCMEFWLGLAMGCGIKVAFPSTSPVLRAPSYGSRNRAETVSLQAMAQDRVRACNEFNIKVQADVNHTMGRFEELKRVKDKLDREEYLKRAQLLQLHIAELTSNLNGNLGALREAHTWFAALNGHQKVTDEPMPVAISGYKV